MAEKNNQISEVLTPDEKMVADFIKTRTQKVLQDIGRLAGEKVCRPEEWSACFVYLSKTYGRDSDEPFKWYKYYFREGLIPAEVALPLLVQVYLDGQVDGGFVNMLARAMKKEPAPVKTERMETMKRELAAYMDAEGRLTLYRGGFEKPFGSEQDASRTIERAFAFTLDREVAKHYACCWFPETAKLWEVKVKPEDVAWYSSYDEEKTVIVLPQSKGGQWQVTAEDCVPSSEYGTDAERRTARQSYNSLFKR